MQGEGFEGAMMQGPGFIWLILFAVLVVVPFWRILPRVGIPSWVSLFAVIPLVPIVLLWVVAFSRWRGDPGDGGGEG